MNDQRDNGGAHNALLILRSHVQEPSGRLSGFYGSVSTQWVSEALEVCSEALISDTSTNTRISRASAELERLAKELRIISNSQL